MDLYVQEVD